MMKFVSVLLLFAQLFVTNVSAQEVSVKNRQITRGAIEYRGYSNNIYKITIRQDNYITDENISDAVILKYDPALPIDVFKISDGQIISTRNQFFQSTHFFLKDGYSGFRFKLGKTTKVFGGGERALPLNRRGYKFNLYNNPWYGYSEGADNLNYSVPFFTTSDGYGLFFDNPSKGYADIGKTDSSIMEVGFTSGEINVYVIFGKDYKEILAGYNKLTGTQPLPPRWALGNLMSRFGYTSEAQAKDILGKMKSENIPVDAIIYDLFWFGDSIKNTMGNLDWVNKTKWPDPKKMIADFKKENVQTILITEPFVVKNSTNYKSSENFLAVDSANKPYTIGDFYFGTGGLIDIFRKDAQDWFWGKHKPQMKNGVEAWWGDLGEPEKHPANLYHNLKDLGFNKRLFKADEVHNLYGHTWTKMLYEKYAKEYPAKRLFSLNRSGFAGTQRYGIFPWSGDVSRSWSGLRAQLPIMLGMSMSGVPYAHADAGGFAGGEGDNELYVRWLQFAAFTPIFRPHGTALYNVDTSSFSYPSEAALIAEPYRRYAKAAIDLRYALLPYNYTIAYQQAATGAPLVAPLYYHYPDDTSAINIVDEYMWGENILVAPVLQKASAARKVYLPGNGWYNLASNELKRGTITDSLDLKRIPIYVKEGSFITYWFPKMDFYHSTAGFTGEKDITVVYYPSAQLSKGSLYNDDGHTKGATGEVVMFKGITQGKKVVIDISGNKDINKKSPAKKIRIVVPVNLKYPLAANLNGKKLADSDLVKTVYFLNNKMGAQYAGFDIIFAGKPIRIEMELE